MNPLRRGGFHKDNSMAQPMAVWGIHMGEHVAARPIEQG